MYECACLYRKAVALNLSSGIASWGRMPNLSDSSTIGIDPSYYIFMDDHYTTHTAYPKDVPQL